MPLPSTRKIVVANHEMTFENGTREYVINVIVEGDPSGYKRAYYKYKDWPGMGREQNHFVFTDEKEAVICAKWLVGQSYIGPP